MRLLAPFVAAVVAGTPAPSPAPASIDQGLHEIARVRAISPFCTALRQTVAPAIAGVMRNDDYIVSSEKQFKQLGLDLGTQTTNLGSVPQTSMAILKLQTISDGIQHNVEMLDKLLATLPDFPDDIALPTDKDLSHINRGLKSVIASQQQQSDFIYGIIETMRLGQMRSDITTTGAERGGPTGGGPSAAGAQPNAQAGGGSDLTNAGLQAKTQPGGMTQNQMLDSTLYGNTVYDKVAQNIAAERIRTIPTEAAVSAVVIRGAVAQCGAQPPPAAVPAPSNR